MQRWIGQIFFFFYLHYNCVNLVLNLKKKNSLYTLNQIIKIWLKL